MPFFSICIPAYKNASYLKRLLDSIVEQTFKDVEVIVTDDSDDESVANLITSYESILPLIYQHNRPAKGSPANWNCGIRMAKGRWIKIMHDDDWFTHKDSLQLFYNVASHATYDFIFSGYHKVNLTNNHKTTFSLSGWNQWLLEKYPLVLYKDNFIGHPSTTLIKNNMDEWFDEHTHWVVDFEFYIRALKKSKGFHVIDQPLISIGISEAQITQSSFRVKEIEIPEFLYLLKKNGQSVLNNLFVFDQYWRLLRNLNISTVDELKPYAIDFDIPPSISSMIKAQQMVGRKTISIGILSKLMMMIAYLNCKIKGELK